ncbi:uncharacterized protein LOC142616073 [Castanea sativa]|uniref:uncharacterized protein LOC142616073 n=1 Tax=Castanea sativa TaxID=21020 RepID=UPI003F650A39
MSLILFAPDQGNPLVKANRGCSSPQMWMCTRESLCGILGFHSTPNLGKYLGFPIKHRGTSNQDLNFILDKVKQKLARWKANLLSLAGRSVLIQASTSTIPAYIMQCTALPNKLLNNIDRVNRNFLWGSLVSSKRTHWVGWHEVTKLKEKGGLGIQSARGRNQALLAKLNWRFHTEKDALWAKVLKSKYCSNQRINARKKDKLPCSRVWEAMKKGGTLLILTDALFAKGKLKPFFIGSGIVRNSVVFRDRYTQLKVHSDALFNALKFQHCVINPKVAGSRKMVQVRWEKPQPGWVSLNTDGSALGNLGRARCGRLIRNEHGDWLGGCSRRIGVTNGFVAELWALRDSLILYHNLHLNVVNIQLDAKALIDVISNHSYTNQVVMPIIDDCMKLISQLAQVLIGHCFREANSCADYLARKGTLQDSSFIVYHDPPVDLLELIHSDKAGLFCTRVITEPSVPL